MSNSVLLVAGIISLAAVLVWMALLIWAAIGDGRDQDRRDASRHL